MRRASCGRVPWRARRVVNSFAVRRTVAILALLSLVAVPLAAWPVDDHCCCDKDCCKSGMCPMHRHREAKPAETGSHCRAGIQCACPTEQAQIAPAPPGVLIAPPQVPIEEKAETAVVAAPNSPEHGFVSPPFVPPRHDV